MLPHRCTHGLEQVPTTSGGSSGTVKSGLVSVPPDSTGMPVLVGRGGEGSPSSHSKQLFFPGVHWEVLADAETL
eukprot:COSAG02_NODE_8523_length_2537_cov_34.997539_2_plen_74_part_00